MPAFMLMVIVLTATILLLMELLARTGTITRTLIRIHRWHGTTFIMCTLTGLVHEFLIKWPVGAEGLCFVTFVIFELSFIALYATEEISYEVSLVLAMFQCGYLSIHLIKSESSSAIACGIALLACWIVKVISYLIVFPSISELHLISNNESIDLYTTQFLFISNKGTSFGRAKEFSHLKMK